jgi:hypothetical protein
MTFTTRFIDRDVSLNWRARSGPPRTHYGARSGEHPRYVIRRERRSGAQFWCVYYRPGGLKDIELAVVPNTLAEAQRAAAEDLAMRVSLGEIKTLDATR